MVGEILPLHELGKLPDQRKFVEAFCGDAEKTAERLGLPVALCKRWALKSWFFDALEKREQREVVALQRDNVYQKLKAITPRLELQAFWSDVAANTQEKMADRLKASEMLAKSHGMLVDKTVVEGNPSKPIMVKKLDIDERITLLLGKPIDAVSTPSEAKPSQPLETTDDDWLSTAECIATVTAESIGTVRSGS